MKPPSPDEFFTGVTARPVLVQGNTVWASERAHEIRKLVVDHAAHAHRSQQVHLGPSELGVACDRQVVEKLLGSPKTNHVSDPWPSVVGTAVHAWLAEAFTTSDPKRWLTERKVTPFEGHDGTADLYDKNTHTVFDHKVLGSSTLDKLIQHGPPRKYELQLIMYGAGYVAAGHMVKRVALIAYPRATATLDKLYVWERPFDASAWSQLETVRVDTSRRKTLAALVRKGGLPLTQVPRTPSSDECFFCPFFRPEAASTGGPGCPGTTG